MTKDEAVSLKRQLVSLDRGIQNITDEKLKEIYTDLSSRMHNACYRAIKEDKTDGNE